MLSRKYSALRDLLKTWIIVGIPVSVGFVAFFISQMNPWTTLVDAVGVGLFWALVTTLTLGTLGYGLVRAVWTESRTGLDYTLLGEDRAETIQWLKGAIALFVLTLTGLLALSPERIAIREQTVPVGVGLELTIGIPALVALIGVLHAYCNRGLLINWALIFAPTAAFWFVAFALPISSGLLSQTRTVLYAGGIALGLAATFGSVSYLFGMGTRAAVSRKSPPSSRNALD